MIRNAKNMYLIIGLVTKVYVWNCPIITTLSPSTDMDCRLKRISFPTLISAQAVPLHYNYVERVSLNVYVYLLMHVLLGWDYRLSLQKGRGCTAIALPKENVHINETRAVYKCMWRQRSLSADAETIKIVMDAWGWGETTVNKATM